MHVQVWLDADALTRWHLELVRSLARRHDTTASVRLLPERTWSTRRSVDTLLTLERRLHGLRRGLTAREDISAVDVYLNNSEPADLAIDLVGADPQPGTRTWRLRFDGAVGIEPAISALLRGRFPVVTLEDLRTEEQVAGGRPGSESPGVASASLDDVLARCTSLIHAALDGSGARGVATSPVETPKASALIKQGLAQTAGAAAHGIYRRAFRAPHWRVGWRFVCDDDVIDLEGHPAGGWNDLPDDGFHFYADPFPIEVDGRTHLFVEDFDHRVGRGVISVVEFDEAGPIGRPAPVLSHDVHLSYPHVFEADGEVWLIPETSAAKRVELYRATHFPAEWELEGVLLDDVEANDATVFRHDGQWWMTATVTDGGSHCDALYVWHSPDLRGPWTAHRGNPVVIDITSARPAGHVVRRGERLIRPVQDCATGYGAALGLMEIVRLDEFAFDQRAIAHITPGTSWPGRRIHTLNRAGRLECIDGSRLVPRFRIRSEGDTP